MPEVRIRFAEALLRLCDEEHEIEGWPEDAIRAVLGEPHDVITEEDQPMRPGEYLWCYGTAGHLSFPSLGVVAFDETRRTIWFGGDTGSPPPADLIPEARLRELFTLIDRVHHHWLEMESFDPRPVVAAVNALRPLGMRRAIAVLKEYARVCPHWGFDRSERAAIVARFLFVGPDGARHPARMSDWRDGSPPQPIWPALVLEGTPIYLEGIGVASFTGGPESAETCLRWYETNGDVRPDSLQPADSPLAAWREWEEAIRPLVASLDQRLAMRADEVIRAHLTRMAESVVTDVPPVSECVTEARWLRWDRVVDELSATPTEWDAASGRHVRAADGSFIAVSRPRRYARVIWELPLEGRRSRVIVRRCDESSVEVDFEQYDHNSPVLPDLILCLTPSDDPKHELARFAVKGDFTFGDLDTGSRESLNHGRRIRATLIKDGTVIAMSPDLDPDRVIEMGP